MNQIIKRLPLTWQNPAREVIRYALSVEPIEYLTNALVVPIFGVLLIVAASLISADLLLKGCVLFGALNILMAVVVVLHKLRSR